jgi:hypothetical protein
MLCTKVCAFFNLHYYFLLACGYVGGQIYCYGGDTSSSLSNFAVDKNLYSLNISQFIGQSTDSMSGHWNTIIPSITFETGNRRTPSSAVLTDGKRLLIQGGLNIPAMTFINQTIIFDTTSNTWQRFSPYSEAGRGARQMYVPQCRYWKYWNSIIKIALTYD